MNIISLTLKQEKKPGTELQDFSLLHPTFLRNKQQENFKFAATKRMRSSKK